MFERIPYRDLPASIRRSHQLKVYCDPECPFTESEIELEYRSGYSYQLEDNAFFCIHTAHISGKKRVDGTSIWIKLVGLPEQMCKFIMNIIPQPKEYLLTDSEHPVWFDQTLTFMCEWLSGLAGEWILKNQNLCGTGPLNAWAEERKVSILPSIRLLDQTIKTVIINRSRINLKRYSDEEGEFCVEKKAKTK